MSIKIASRKVSRKDVEHVIGEAVLLGIDIPVVVKSFKDKNLGHLDRAGKAYVQHIIDIVDRNDEVALDLLRREYYSR